MYFGISSERERVAHTTIQAMLCETKEIVKMLISAFYTKWSLCQDIFQGCAHNTHVARKA